VPPTETEKDIEVGARPTEGAPAVSAVAEIGESEKTVPVVHCAGKEASVEYPELTFSNQPCITVVERMEHLDQASGLGFSAVEVLARLVGESNSSLIWLPPRAGDQYLLDYGPESGTSNVRVQISAA